MKFNFIGGKIKGDASHPVRGAWIEIYPVKGYAGAGQRSHPVRGAWIEIRRAS